MCIPFTTLGPLMSSRGMMRSFFMALGTEWFYATGRQIFAAIATFFHAMGQNIPLSGPDISQQDIDAVTDVLRTSQLSLGPKLPEFEQAFARYVGVKHAVAVNSGTSALHLCMRTLDIKDGDEVITSPFSFIASASCILFERAKPVFVDILPETFCLDPAKIEEAITPRTKAILGVDIFGYLADWGELQRIAKEHDLLLIEDACEALGTSYSGNMAGSFGDCAVFGFYPNKQLTTGEGGMIVTNRDDIAELACSMRNQGRNADGGFLCHERLGYNYRLSDINCALGISQLAALPERVAKRIQVAQWYGEELADREELLLFQPQTNVSISWFVYVIRLQDQYSMQSRDALITYLQKNGIGCNTYFPAIHLQPLFRNLGWHEGMFPVTERIAQRTIALPFSSKLSREEVAHACNVLKDGLRSLS